MKKIVYIICFILSLSISTKAQNLVSNGEFGAYDTTSTGAVFAKGWDMYASPDYYNAAYGYVPYNIGYQEDCCGGKGYIGEYMICSGGTGGDDGCREYIKTKLIDTLKIGHKYLASMYVNRSNDFNYSIATIGMLFTDTVIPSPPYPQFVVINATPQVKNNTLLTDTINWILVQDTFIAAGTEIYLTIGNFNSAATSDTVQSNGTWPYSGSAYYYIDGVSVYDLTNEICNTYWDAGYDKYVLAGDSVQLGAIASDNSTYKWLSSLGGSTYLNNDTLPNPWSKPVRNTRYYATKTCSGNSITDTVTVYVVPKVHLGNDTVYCGNFNLPIVLDAGAGQGYVYQWSTGAATQTISVTTSGTYSVKVSSSAVVIPSNPAGYGTDAVTLGIYNTSYFDVLHDTVLCDSSQFPITLNGTVATTPGTYNYYSWAGGHIGAQLSVNKAGMYIINVFIKDSNTNGVICKYRDTAVVTLGCSGIEQLTGGGEWINVYPNPASTVLQIVVSRGQIAGVSMYDVLGNEVLNTKEKEIDVSSLNSGVYFVEVKTIEGIYTKKIIVQH